MRTLGRFDTAVGIAHRQDPETLRSLTETLDRVLRRLDSHGIPWCLLRNRDRLPGSLLTGSDVDLVVPNTLSAGEALDLFRDFRPIHVVDHDPPLKLYLPAGAGVLRVDVINHDVAWLGATYLRTDDILRDRRLDRGIWVASESIQAYDAWIGSLLWNGAFKPRYAPLIARAFARDRDGLTRLLEAAFGARLARELAALDSPARIALSRALAGRCRRALWGRQLARHPGRTVTGVLGYASRRAGFRVEPPGMVVAILGPDGAGKSLVTDELARQMLPYLPFDRAEIEHISRPFLPSPANLRRGRVRSPAGATPVNTDPHGKPARGALLSALRLGYTVIDQWLSEARWGRHALARNVLRIQDRHLLDLRVDPARSRYGGPGWLATLATRLAPAPDVVILLDAPVNVLRARKCEVPLAETERQRDAYRRLVETLPTGRVVDAARPVADVVADVRAAILEQLAARTAGRLDHRRAAGRGSA